MTSQAYAHTAVSKVGTLHSAPRLYLELRSTQLVVNDAVDTEVVAQEIHSSAHTPAPRP